MPRRMRDALARRRRLPSVAMTASPATTVLGLSADAFGYLGLAVLAVALVLLAISVFHPEALRRPGGFLDGRGPPPPEEPRRDRTR